MANKNYEEWVCKPKDMLFNETGANVGLSKTGPVVFVKDKKISDRKLTPDEARAFNAGYNVGSNTECNLILPAETETEFLISEIQY